MELTRSKSRVGVTLEEPVINTLGTDLNGKERTMSPSDF